MSLSPPGITRELLLGASPRSALYLQRVSRGSGPAVNGREFVTPDDIKALARPVLEHRLALRPEAQMRGTDMAADHRIGASEASTYRVPARGPSQGHEPPAHRTVGRCMMVTDRGWSAIGAGIALIVLWWALGEDRACWPRVCCPDRGESPSERSLVRTSSNTLHLGHPTTPTEPGP